MKQWETVIGIETHIHLLTRSKIFSGSSTAFGAEPNAQANAVGRKKPSSRAKTISVPISLV